MTTTQPDLELVEILKRLGLRTTWGEDYETHYEALWNVIRWICEVPIWISSTLMTLHIG